ncbi:hypothetical protein HK16_18370 [Acetobacter senegalensis]|uniref:Uncharacterized protein n=2 Tax=Acetobacter TaxID=434 RepID=A0A252EFX4_9PROT|nr:MULTISPECIES: hypothetical protein [Acetobacter]ATJ90709.1 hypothetical protein CIW82_08430 [Acetobacter tropicalis]OUL65202.1 hypothetical protein HK16_18370 [Acetobacter senegalensis]
MKSHNPTRTPAASACQPDVVRGAALIVSVWMICAAWKKIEKRKLVHDRHKTAVQIAFTQNKLSVRRCEDYAPFVLDLNRLLQPFVLVIFFRRIKVRFNKACNFLKRCFKFGYTLFKFFNSLFHRIVRVGVVEGATLDGAGSGGNTAACNATERR